ncbi:hypothetical protein GGQ87_001906 [Brevundimonas alba]|uniref:RapA2 cadherin-like domain-containing protein n=1 Tax=Brevundimonas alba TaxID=74314 RepID=A0A7X6BN07_9CAUL|nr:calcium-binding protein [Brevundimonas alba]NJC41648.1 hypothetical protein [Brevundimonas alba]
MRSIRTDRNADHRAAGREAQILLGAAAGSGPSSAPHTGGVAISGSATEDQVLTAVSTMADADGLGTLHYQWQHNVGSGFVNVGADQATYTLGDGDVGGIVRVIVSYTDGNGAPESATSASTASISNINDPHTGGASVSGVRVENQTLTAVSTLADVDGLGTLHYQWQRNAGAGFVNVGLDQATYVLGDADVGGTVRVVISYVDQQGTAESATSAATIPISNVNDPHSGGASITGTPTENQVLTAVSTMADPDGLGTLHYQWQHNVGLGFVNVGADQSTYTLGDGDVGGVVRVIISYTDGHGTAESASSSGTASISAVNDPHTGGASITGTPTEDQLLTAVSTLADVDGLGTLHYQWQRNVGLGFSNVGADQSTYTLGDADVGGVVRVVVSYTDQQGFSESATSPSSASISNVNDSPSGAPSITGTRTENQVLTADTGSLFDPDGLGTLHYQWQRNVGSGFVNAGADQPTYTLGDADVGGVVRVVVSYVDQQGTSEAVTSAATSTIANVNDPHTGGASITGTATEDQVLTAVSTMADVDGLGVLHYQWQRDTGSGFVNVGLDQATYTLGDADVGGIMRVVISYVDLNGGSESGTSPATAVIANVPDAPIAVNDAVSVNESAILSGSVFLNNGSGLDTDPDGPALSVSAVNGSGAAVGIQIALPSGALLKLNANGTFNYNPNGVFLFLPGPASGASNQTYADTFTYTLAGGGTATVTVTIQGQDSNGDYLLGTSGANILNGGIGDDVIDGGGGDDLIDGGDGIDSIYGGEGADTIHGGDGTEEDVHGEGGDDILYSGGEGHYYGEGGDDLIIAGLTDSVNEVLDGGSGIDTLDTRTWDGDYVIDMVSGATNYGEIYTTFENVITGGGNDTITGNAEANVIRTNLGNDTLNGAGGNDVLAGGAGVDVLNGDGGIDTADYSTAAAGVNAQLNANKSTNDGDGGTDTFTSIENLTGSAFNDTLIGDGGVNVLRGGLGTDTLLGLGGNDVLWGGAGALNALQGGAGDDTYVLEAADTVTEFVGDGTDTVDARINTYVLANNVENLIFGGVGNFAGTGNAAANVMSGGAGDDVLRGRGGADTMNGGGGLDTVDYTLAAAGATIRLDLQKATADGDGAIDTFTSIENAIGSNFNDTIFGTAGDNVIQGGNGTDVLLGLGGNDILMGGSGGAANQLQGGMGDDLYILDAFDTVVESAGEGVDTIQARVGTYTLGNNVENLIYTGPGKFVGNGNTMNNVLTGGALNDIFSGKGGNDTINGGLGTDEVQLRGVAANYTITAEGAGWRIVDSVAGRDGSTFVTSVEVLRFANNTTMTLTYAGPAPFEPVGKAFSAQVLPTLVHDGGLVLPALVDDQPLVLPDAEAFKIADEPLVLPGAEDDAPLLLALEARLDSHLAFIGDWMIALDPDGQLAGLPAYRENGWF